MNKSSQSGIPKVIHIVWIGDESLCPQNCIQTWRDNHPDWDFKLWGNESWKKGDWRNKHHMDQIAATGKLCAVADLMRWEILLNEGGVTVDADSISMLPLPDWMMETDLFACYENEQERPGLVCNSLVGAKPNHAVTRHLVEGLSQQKNIADKFVWYKMKRKKIKPWKTTGPLAFTQALKNTNCNNASIFPSHLSMPIHYSGRQYTGSGPVFCCQFFAGTGTSSYQSLLDLTSNQLLDRVYKQLGRARPGMNKNVGASV